MPEITVSITASQQKGLEYAARSVQSWAEDVIRQRAGKAENEIIDKTVKHCLDNNIQIPATRDAIITYAFENDIVKTAQQVWDEQEAEMQAEAAE